jgi:hypothetical protein
MNTCADCSAFCASYRCASCNARRAASQRSRRTVRSPEQRTRDCAYQRAYAAKRYAERRAAGLCVACTEPSEQLAYCQSCRVDEARRNADRALVDSVVQVIAARGKK